MSADAHPYEIAMSSGDRAEADTPEAAMLAAYTMQRDHRERYGYAFPEPSALIKFEGETMLSITRRIQRHEVG